MAQMTAPGVNNFIKLMETGLGTVDNPTLSIFFSTHPGAALDFADPLSSNVMKMSLARQATDEQLEYAKTVDSLISDRARIAALDILDCAPNLSLSPRIDSIINNVIGVSIADVTSSTAWKSEKPRIEKAMTAFTTDIMLLRTEGAEEKEVKDWENQKDMLKWSIDMITDSYLPNSKRKEQYGKIYNDITERDARLRARLKVIRAQKKLDAYVTGSDIDSLDRVRYDSLMLLNDKARAAGEALARWKLAGAVTVSK